MLRLHLRKMMGISKGLEQPHPFPPGGGETGSRGYDICTSNRPSQFAENIDPWKAAHEIISIPN